jgi:hypothetical protein
MRRAILVGMNASIRQGIPLVPQPDLARERAVASLARAAVLVARRVFDRSPQAEESFVKERGWDGDRAAGILTRAASGPAMTTQAGWAKELATVSQAFLRTLTPMSAAAALLDQSVQVSFDGAGKITLPTITPGSRRGSRRVRPSASRRCRPERGRASSLTSSRRSFCSPVR